MTYTFWGARSGFASRLLSDGSTFIIRYWYGT
jgi:hypothetical protein